LVADCDTTLASWQVGSAIRTRQAVPSRRGRSRFCGQIKTRRFSHWKDVGRNQLDGVRCGKPQQGCAGNLPVERGSLAMVWSHGIVDPESEQAKKPGERLRGQKARRRKCRHTAAKGATENAAATVERSKSCHHLAVMSNFAPEATLAAAAAPCHCTAVTGGASGCGRIFAGNNGIAAGNWLMMSQK